MLSASRQFRYSQVATAPKRIRGLIATISVVMLSVQLLTATLGFYLLKTADHLHRSTKWGLFLLTFGDIFTFVLLAARAIWTARIQNRLSITLPEFGLSVMPAFARTTSILVSLVLCTYAITLSILYLRSLYLDGTDWLLPLSGAWYVLLLVSIFLLIVLKGIQRTIHVPITQLEQQILVEDLSSTQIKQRFNEHMLGETFHQWLKDAVSRVERCYERGRETVREWGANIADLERSWNSPDEMKVAIEKIGNHDSQRIAWNLDMEACDKLLQHATTLSLTPEQWAAVEESLKRAKDLNDSSKETKVQLGELHAKVATLLTQAKNLHGGVMPSKR